ncbi:hypothetical protein Tco_0871900, partial [Tanacetum coccineum]
SAEQFHTVSLVIMPCQLLKHNLEASSINDFYDDGLISSYTEAVIPFHIRDLYFIPAMLINLSQGWHNEQR